jgi:thioredoxin-like negative regulator of GroEL
LEALVEAKEGTRLLKIDVDTWGSDVARQYGIRSLPTLWLYEGTELESRDSREIWERLQE